MCAGVAASTHVSRLVLAGRSTAVAGYVAHSLAPLLLVRLLAIAPAVSPREDVFDAFVGFELAGLGRPVRSECASVHVLELAGFA